MKIILVIFVCGILAACQSTPSPMTSRQPFIPSDLKITLERGPCRKGCPEYTVTINSNGQVIFGEEKPDALRNTPFIANQEQLQQLVEAIETSNFFALRVPQTIAGKDISSTAITIMLNGQSRHIEHQNSCNTRYNDALQELCDLEELIDGVTGANGLQGGLAFTPTPPPTSPSNKVVLIGQLLSIQDAPDCGIVHWSAVAEYTDLQIISGTYPYDVVYVIHGCPELKRSEYAQGSGDLESFNVGDYHELHLTRENVYHTMDHSNELYMKDRLYFSKVVNLYKQ
jgi:hypothetical protein